MWRFLCGLIVGGGLLALGVWTFWRNPSSPSDALSATLISPQPDSQTDLVTTKPFKSVEFLYEIRNNTTRDFTGVNAQLFCQCAVGEKLPETLAAGQTARFAISFRAPNVGIRRETITISCNGHAELLKLTPAIRADLVTPAIVSAPKNPVVTVILGEESTQEMLLLVMEKAEQPPMIEAVEVEPAELLSARALLTSERPQADGESTLRTYQIQLQSNSSVNSETIPSEGILTWKTREKFPQDQSTLSFTLKAVPPFAAVPSSLEFRAGTDDSITRNVTLVRRGESEYSPIAINYDRSLIEVIPRQKSTKEHTVWEIHPIRTVEEAQTTRIVFANQSTNTPVLALPVTLYPAKPQ